MQAGRRYSFILTLKWQAWPLILFAVWAAVPVVLYTSLDIRWAHLPWQPLSLIGIAVAFYLGFKNNSSYDRLWEARKIWGGIVNASRAFTVMTRSYIRDDQGKDCSEIQQRVVHRHVAWLHALTYQLRMTKPWEHNDKRALTSRAFLETQYNEQKFDNLRPYLDEAEFEYILSKGNRASHLLNQQTKELMGLRTSGEIEHFRHLQMQEMITEFFTLQGKAERIKNFPFPRQYASVNYFFVVIFVALLPFGMLSIFGASQVSVWLTVPFSALCSWVFWMMEQSETTARTRLKVSITTFPLQQWPEA